MGLNLLHIISKYMGLFATKYIPLISSAEITEYNVKGIGTIIVTEKNGKEESELINSYILDGIPCDGIIFLFIIPIVYVLCFFF